MSRAVVLFIILASLTASVIAEVHVISVGQDNKNQFVPNTVNAAKGDVVAFNFVGGQHDVVQASSYGNCSKMANGFESGLNPSSNWYNYTVDKSSGRIWFFCNVFIHCKNFNMTGGIIITSNAPAAHLVSTGFTIMISTIIATFFIFN